MGRTPNIPEQIWGKIMIGSPDSCWPFMGGKAGTNGYGSFVIGRTRCLAHRVVFSLANPGKIDWKCGKTLKDTKIVLHKCDNRLCCNPNHLYLGTPKENYDDMVKKGRRADMKGEKGPNSKFTNSQIMKIREICSKGLIEQKDIAALCGVSEGVISSIKRKETYINAT